MFLMEDTDQLFGLVINEYELNAIEANYPLENYSYACEIYKVMWSCGYRISLHLKDPFLKFHLLCCILHNLYFFFQDSDQPDLIYHVRTLFRQAAPRRRLGAL